MRMRAAVLEELGTQLMEAKDGIRSVIELG
jgi:hypothetical protein